MSSKKYAAPLILERRRSRLQAAVVIVVHGLALALLPTLTLPVWVTAPLAVAVLLSLTIILREHVLLNSKRSICRLVWDADEHWTIYFTHGVSVPARLLPGSFVHHSLVVLIFALETKRRRHALVLTRDSLDADTFRRLRVRLKIESGIATLATGQ